MNYSLVIGFIISFGFHLLSDLYIINSNIFVKFPFFNTKVAFVLFVAIFYKFYGFFFHVWLILHFISAIVLLKCIINLEKGYTRTFFFNSQVVYYKDNILNIMLFIRSIKCPIKNDKFWQFFCSVTTSFRVKFLMKFLGQGLWRFSKVPIMFLFCQNLWDLIRNELFGYEISLLCYLSKE